MQVVKVLGTQFKHELSPSELSKAKTDILAAVTFAKAVRSKIGANSAQQLDAAIAQYLSSTEVKLACAFLAGRKMAERHRPSLGRLLEIPAELDVAQPLKETHRLTVKEKKSGNGDLRFIRNFGPVHRTGQLMVLHVVERLFVPQAWQNTFTGLPHIVGIIKSALLGGTVYFATLDIKNHYGSFSIKELVNWLPTPQMWVENVVGARHASVGDVKVSSQYIPLSKLILLAQPGLPLGSICSPMIAAHSVSFLKWTPNPHRMLVNYADNFLLLATSSQALWEGIDELTAAVGKLPAGKFQLKTQSDGHAGHGFDFLGHNLRPHQDKVRVVPSVWNEQALYELCSVMSGKVDTSLKMGDETSAIRHVESWCAKGKGWLAAFSACDNIDEFRNSLEVSIAKDASPLQVNVKELMDAASPDYEYLGNEYQYV